MVVISCVSDLHHSLTAGQALELELDSYAGLVKEMSSVGDAMVKASHPDAKMIQQRQQLINQQLKVRQTLTVKSWS